MKRLKLEDFKLKNLKETSKNSTDGLLAQVLGDCHDGHKQISHMDITDGGYAYDSRGGD